MIVIGDIGVTSLFETRILNCFFLVDVEIVFIDIFNKSFLKRGLVVGITFIKVFRFFLFIRCFFRVYGVRFTEVGSYFFCRFYFSLRLVFFFRISGIRVVFFLIFIVITNLVLSIISILLFVSVVRKEGGMGRAGGGLRGFVYISSCFFCRELFEFGVLVYVFLVVLCRVRKSRALYNEYVCVGRDVVANWRLYICL